MKILYVNPARLEAGMDAIIKGAPLALISIAAMVPEHDAELFDFKVDKYKEKKFKALLDRTDVVAITSMTPQIYSAFEVATMAKERGCTTIMGGYHPTLAPDFVAKHPDVDYIVRGEGEHTFKELIDYIDRGKDDCSIKKINGISYKKNGKVIHNKARKLECNLDNFPRPRRDLLDGKLYTYLGTTTRQVETSRGCPHSCKFCCIAKMWRDPTQRLSYRTKSLKRIMREIYDVDWKNNFIFFCEDNFSINVKRTKKILETIIRSGVQTKLHFSCQSRVDTLYRNPELIELFDKAGFRQIFLGVESVHQQSLDAMNKRNTTPDMVRKVVKMLRDRGISIFGGVIIGYPGETKKMVRQTIHYARTLDMDCVQFTPITAFPGTEFYDEMEEKGMITSRNYKHYDLFHPMMRTEQLSNIELYRLVAEAYAYYYMDRTWLKNRAKEYLNPFGKFNWMLNSIFRLIKQGVKGGTGMLFSQGITTSVISDELKELDNHD
ncbi:MAG: radical SAM protein [Candidatus Lokiarchaeota archaeon]|nr:radical SAM protein [Candidatus Lokiarchaeota archaeon]MBD3338334.1 radical SAM protein [Candidatus Lokiarchaeota archaeon]